MKSVSVEDEVRRSGAIGRVSMITLSSRILGLVREQIKAFFMGTGLAADAFTVAFMIPNLLRRFLAEGVMSAAVVPVFTEYLGAREREEARRFVSILLGGLLLLLVLVVSAGVFLAPAYIPLFFPTFAADTAVLTSLLTAIMFPYIGLTTGTTDGRRNAWLSLTQRAVAAETCSQIAFTYRTNRSGIW